MDNVISFVSGVPIGSDVENPELTDIKLPEDNVWMAAVTAAMQEKAVWGALLFVTEDGDYFRIPIKTDYIALRGLFEFALDDIKLD